MKFLIASDIHGNAGSAERLAARYKEENASRLILLGDILYHGPRNPVISGYDPLKTAEILNGLKDDILCVRGNCDAEIDRSLLEFPVTAECVYLVVGGIFIFLTHGHDMRDAPKLKNNDVLLAGHTHVPRLVDNGGHVEANPGSVTYPKNGSERSYMTLEDGAFTLKTLDGEEFGFLKI